jgi:hypothetical protein
MPGVIPRAPDDDAQARPTDQVSQLSEQRVIASPSLRKEMEAAHQELMASSPSDTTVPEQRPRSLFPWVLAALASAGFIGGLGYMVMSRPSEQPSAPAPVVVAAEKPVEAPTPPVVAPAPERSAPKPVEAVAPPSPTAPAPKTAEPKPVEAVAAPPPTVPAPKTAEPEIGWVQITATPYAEVTVDGRPLKDAVEGVKKIPLRAGAHLLILKHPRRTEPITLTISPKKTTFIVFRPLEPMP